MTITPPPTTTTTTISKENIDRSPECFSGGLSCLQQLGIGPEDLGPNCAMRAPYEKSVGIKVEQKFHKCEMIEGKMNVG
jgi:hypothetical protein